MLTRVGQLSSVAAAGGNDPQDVVTGAEKGDTIFKRKLITKSLFFFNLTRDAKWPGGACN